MGLLACGLLAVVAGDQYVALQAAPWVHSDIDAVPSYDVALVLGTTRAINGIPNRFYTARIAAAAALYHEGKVHHLLVSGDNAERWYNEPVDMWADLIEAGVPAEAITLDYAGFRTLDSVVRAQRVFGQDRILIVSQRFHSLRAVFLARAHGLEAEAFAAADVPGASGYRVRIREAGARLKAVADLLTGKEPRFLGEPIVIPKTKPDSLGHTWPQLAW